MVGGTVGVPDVAKLAEKSLEELRYLSIAQIEWNTCMRMAFTLTDG